MTLRRLSIFDRYQRRFDLPEIASKEDLALLIKKSLGYQSGWSVPKVVEGRVSGNKVNIALKGWLVSWPGRGRFDGIIQDVGGSISLVGHFNSPGIATSFGAAFGAMLAMAGGGSISSVAPALLCPIGSYAMVRLDHYRIEKALLMVLNTRAQ
jgi:hypothetical protein